ncbi:biotin carboxylase N-terminal domain-containing protein [Isoptericola jiangsuensis]|uniref:ATP-binding protein n=1 Tax=Isoptericola jiangsuensis TaxID=548579 RepID=UPI003AAF4199
MFGTVLVANRGEIACRVTGTLRRLGVRSVAVHTDVDAGARHVREADVAVPLGPAGGYLDVDAVVAAALAAGAEAIHPGYGFLSENPALARACAASGLVFVGPPVEAVETMADKVAAKRLVAKHDVPVLAGTLDAALDDAALVAAAGDVGFPLLVKPVAGGGGKGMEVVRQGADLPAALASARRVAAAAFGDDGLLLERLVDSPRHVEVQVLADSHGTVVHLGERECTLQRRHQKIVEEAPSPALDDATRARLGAAACEVARSVGYVGVGTVEFLVPAGDPTDFAFIEMNTRLQVEHPVTEMVTGLDLVEAQLRVAAGEPLWFGQGDVRVTGHAIEARVYAESPQRGFLPSAGRVLWFDDGGAAAGPGPGTSTVPVRLDAGIGTGDVVSGDYDPLVAKAVAHGVDRAQALARLDGLLGRVVVLGVETNGAFLRDLLADDDVRAGLLDTGLVDRFVADRVPSSTRPSTPDRRTCPDDDRACPGGPSGGPDGPPGHARREEGVVVAAALLAAGALVPAAVPADPWAADGWRLNGPPAPQSVALRAPGGDVVEVSVTADGDTHVVGPADRFTVRPTGTHRWSLTSASGTVHVTALRDGDAAWVAVAGRTAVFTILDRPAAAARRRAARALAAAADGGAPGRPAPAGPVEIRAQMPGTVAATPHADGVPVEAGAAVVVVEAMKMEHPLTAPTAGTLRLAVHPGDQVRLDQVVAVVEPEGAP